MKMKLLLFVGLITGSLGLSLLFGTPAFAAGESYKWINDTTIEATGGAYDSKIMTSKQFGSGGGTATPIKKVTFVRDGTTNVFKATGGELYYVIGTSGTLGGATKCNLQLSLAATTLTDATLSVNDPIGTKCPDSTLTTTISGIGATEAGPPAEDIAAAAKAAADKAAGSKGEAAKSSTCKIDAVGWIICPAMDLAAKVIDGAYGFVKSLMIIKPITTSKTPEAANMYAAWQIMRNFANVAFVIAFMVIIFSQMTSIGLNNYGIKKMLPRLIVAAILVNASYWICAIAVDISNILGASLNGLFSSVIPDAAKSADFKATSSWNTSGGWQGIVGAVLVGSAVAVGFLYATLSALIPALLAALIAILTVFIVLTLRQALIILLIIISPLAFVAYLLPNTESLFKKWYGLFKTLLLMYPIIALIFGASSLASTIVMTSATGDYKIAIQIMGALISIIPLALTPIVMKTAGGLLNRVGGFINNPNKGPIDGIRKKAGAYKDRRQAIAKDRRLRGTNMLDATSERYRNSSSRFGRGVGKALGGAAWVVQPGSALNSKIAETGLATELKNENAKKALTDTQQSYVANKASTDPRFAQSIAGPTGNVAKLQAAALEAVEKRKSEETRAQETLVKLSPQFQGDVNKAWEYAIKNNDTTLAKAVQNIKLSQQGSAGVDDYKNLINAAENTNDPNKQLSADMAKALRTNIAENHTGMKGVAADIDAWAHSTQKLNEHTADASLWRGLSDTHGAGQTPGSIASAGAVGGFDATRANSILQNDRLNINMKGAQKQAFQDIVNPPNNP